MKLKRIISLISAVALCLSLISCSSGNNSGSSSKTESTVSTSHNSSTTEDSTPSVTSVTLTESWNFDSGFYPVLTASNSNNYGSTYWQSNFYDTLVGYDEKGEIEGRLAESWNISEDGKTYTFNLREGVKFSDGTDLTADAVKQSFEAVQSNLGAYNGSYGMVTALITDITAQDDSTVILTLSQPYYAALNDLTMCTPLAVVNQAAFENGAEGAYAICENKTMGTGPYMYDGQFDNNTYTFVRNPYYWGEEPELESFKIKVIEDNDAKVLALRSGEIDAIIGSTRMNYDAFAELSADNSFDSSVSSDNTMTRYIGLNLAEAPFDDILVRQAISYAIDNETISESILGSIEAPADVLFNSDKPYCDVSQTTYEFNLDKANELMEQAGWVDTDGDGIREKDGITLEVPLCYTQSLGSLDDAVLAISDQLSKIGFKVTVEGTDLMSWYGLLQAGDYSLSLYYTYGGAYDPSTVMTNMNPNISADPIFMQCAAFFDDGAALIDELNSTTDLDRVQEIYAEILGKISEQAAVIPLTYTREFAVWNSDVISSYDYNNDSQYVNIAGIHVK